MDGILKAGTQFPKELADYNGTATVMVDLRVTEVEDGHKFVPVKKMKQNEGMVILKNTDIFNAIGGTNYFMLS